MKSSKFPDLYKFHLPFEKNYLSLDIPKYPPKIYKTARNVDTDVGLISEIFDCLKPERDISVKS